MNDSRAQIVTLLAGFCELLHITYNEFPDCQRASAAHQKIFPIPFPPYSLQWASRKFFISAYNTMPGSYQVDVENMMLFHWISLWLTGKYHDHANVPFFFHCSCLLHSSYWCLLRFLFRKIWILKPIIGTHIQLLPNFRIGVSTKLQLIRIYSRFSSLVSDVFIVIIQSMSASTVWRLCCATRSFTMALNVFLL